MSNEQKLISEQLHLTVGDVKALAVSDSKLHDMISELVDNSISSYAAKLPVNQNYDKVRDLGDFSVEGLKISIHFIGRNIYFCDNSVGMSLDKLDRSLAFGQKNNEDKMTFINHFGIGLKEAAFFFSNWFSIYTKEENSNNVSFCEMRIEDKKNSDPFSWQPTSIGIDKVVNHINKVSQKPKKVTDNFSTYGEDKIINNNVLDQEIGSGTSIVLRNCFSSNIDEAKVRNLKYILSWKFNGFIKKGLKLSINYNLSKKVKPTDIPDRDVIEPFFPVFECPQKYVKKLSDYYKFLKRDGKIDKFEKFDIDMLKNKLISTLEGNPNSNKLTSKINQFFSDQETEIKQKSKIEFSNGSIDVEIGYLAYRWRGASVEEIHNLSKSEYEDYSRNTGFTVMQFGRAIQCGPNSSDEDFDSGNWFVEGVHKFNFSNALERRKFGIVNLDNAINLVTLDANKRAFFFNRREDKIKFVKFINEIYDEFDEMMNLFNKLQIKLLTILIDSKQEKDNQKLVWTKNIQEVRKAVGEIGMPSKVKSEEISTLKSFLIKDERGDPLLKVNVLFTTAISFKLIDYEFVEEVLTIQVFENNPIWSPLLIKDEPALNEYPMQSIAKFSIILALSFYLSDNRHNDTLLPSLIERTIKGLNLSIQNSDFDLLKLIDGLYRTLTGE